MYGNIVFIIFYSILPIFPIWFLACELNNKTKIDRASFIFATHSQTYPQTKHIQAREWERVFFHRTIRGTHKQGKLYGRQGLGYKTIKSFVIYLLLVFFICFHFISAIVFFIWLLHSLWQYQVFWVNFIFWINPIWELQHLHYIQYCLAHFLCFFFIFAAEQRVLNFVYYIECVRKIILS